MFNIGWSEIVVIGVVALIAIGPKELPGVLRTLGQAMAKVRRMAAEFQGQFNEAMREAEMADLKKDVEAATGGFSNFDPLAETKKDIERSFEDKPAVITDVGTPAGPAATVPPIDVPLPEPVTSLTAADFSPAPPPAAPAVIKPKTKAAPAKKPAVKKKTVRKSSAKGAA